MATTERELLVGIARGSNAAARELWARHAPRLLAFLRAMLPPGGPVDPEDVLQQTFCRILETSVGSLRRVEDVPAWLFQVARHIAFNSGRSLKRERARIERRPAPAIHTEPVVRDEALWGALSALMPDLRDVVLLKHIAGLTFDQIAIATLTNRNTAASRYRAAIAQIEQGLAARDGPRAPSTGRHAAEVTHG